MKILSLRVKSFLIILLFILLAVKLKACIVDKCSIIVDSSQCKSPCLIGQACLNCQTENCRTCNTCQNNTCRACQEERRRFVFNTRCSTCNICKNKELNSLNSKICKSNNINCCSLPTCITPTQDCLIACNRPRSIFIPRSQGANTARELVGWQDFIWQFRPCESFVTTAHTFSYSKSFRPERLAQYLFGTCSLNFAGSLVHDKLPCAIIADYFGLSPNFTGTLAVSPLIENFVFDNQWFFGLNSVTPGLYFRIHAPLVHTRWDLRPCQISGNSQETCTPFAACMMSENPARSTCNILQALSGNFTFGDMQTPWCAGKFCNKALTKTGLADVDLILGFNTCQDELSHWGYYIQAVFPTGNKPNSRFIFEPIIGNGKHFELGAGVSGHLTLWSRGPDQTLCGYLEGNITHMFKNTQLRSFDFCKNGPLSRYMLLKEFEQIGSQLVYNGNLINAINFTTRPVDSTVAVKGDISAKLAYRSKCWNVDLGYNFYGQTEEKLKLLKCKLPIDNRKFGVKGTEDVCALEYSITNSLPPLFNSLQNKLTVNSTQNNATICSSGTPDASQEIFSPNNNIAVTATSKQTGIAEGSDVILAHNSLSPKLVSVKDLDIDSGRAGPTATHKLFGHVNYIFNNCCYTPYLGVGGELEVDALACNKRTSLNQWSVWLKGGIAF